MSAQITHVDPEETIRKLKAKVARLEKALAAQPTDPTGQAPCARHCEATAFQIVIKNLKGEIERLKAAQLALVQEPVAWPCVIAEADFEKNTVTLEMQCSDYKVGAGQHWLHTSPPAAHRQWVGLTDEERDTLIRAFNGLAVSFYKAIETKLKQKNGGQP